MSRLRLEGRVAGSILMTAAIASAGALIIALAPLTGSVRLGLGMGLAAVVIWLGIRMARRSLRPLASATTVIEALRDGDYALRLNSRLKGMLGELGYSVNLLADALHKRSLDNRESGLLLGKVLEEIELPVLAFHQDGTLVLSNPAARKLIGVELHEGVTAAALGIDGLLEGELEQSTRLVFPGGSGRYLVRRRMFRLGGIPHKLLVLAEVGSVISAERNEAWQSLVRVMSHEINNSLSPIKSLAETWKGRADDSDRELDRQRLADSLGLIARRSASLSRFVGIYAGLAKLPEPSREPVRVRELVEKICALETRVEIGCDGDDLTVELDRDQFEQALINLVRNAVDASSESGKAEVSIRWRRDGQGACIDVIDNGPGPPDTENLFVPFFTTKPDGSGIGLLLVRRIAELHGGWFELKTRHDERQGALARLWLPGAPAASTGGARRAS